MERPYLSNAKVNEKYVSRKLCVEEKEDRNLCQIPWTAKNYSCSFCRREFRTAQALGGHMNVHRRDRAKLRLLPSWISEKPCTYPNPNFSSSASSPNLLHFSCKRQSYASSSSTSLTFLSSPFLTSADQEKSSLFSFSGPIERDLAKRKSVVGEAKGLAWETEFDQVLKKEKIISLDLKEVPCKDPTEYLDLELRLGYV